MPVSPPKAELLSLTAALCIWLGEVKVTGCELSWPALSGHKAMEAVHALTNQGGGDWPCGGLGVGGDCRGRCTASHKEGEKETLLFKLLINWGKITN